MKPEARRIDVVTQHFGPDVVVYDQVRDVAHALSPVAAHVYEHADGTRDVDALAAGVSATLNIPHDPALVEEALAELGRVELLAVASAQNAIGRREALYRVGLAALPLVTSLAVPAPALAQSRDKRDKPKKPKKPKGGKKNG